MKIAFQAIRTRPGWPRFDRIVKEVERTVDGTVKPELLAQFDRIVADWDHKPTFAARKRIAPGGISLYVYPTGPHKNLWIWVSGGTKGPYPIPKQPRPPGFPLRFRTGYKPHTWPGLGKKYGGPGVSVGPWVSAHQVQHPGIKAREFEKDIARRYKQKFARHIFRAIRRGETKL